MIPSTSVTVGLAAETTPVFHDQAVDKTGLFGSHRRFSKINWYEKLFLFTAFVAAIATYIFTLLRLVEVSRDEDDFAYGIVILVVTVFLLLFLVNGILYQRTSDIVAFFISACMLTIYVIVHFVMRCKKNCIDDTDAKLRLARLITTVFFNILFIPLSIKVIQDYQGDEFAKRLLGFFPEQHRPLKIYNIFDCIARINTMILFSLLMLNLYNFNQFEAVDTVFLISGIPITLLWLGIGIGMVRIENYVLVAIFLIISLFQPAFIVYCLISAIGYAPEPSTTSPLPPTTTMRPTSVTGIMNLMSLAESIVPVVQALYVCIALNIFTYLLSIIFAFLCIRNFGKGLKEKVFNSRADKWFQQHCCNLFNRNP